MKKLLLFLFTVCLLAGCGAQVDTPETKPAQPVPTEAAAVTEPSRSPDMVALVVSDRLSVAYTLTAPDPNGDYGEDISINAQGGEALAKWLLGQSALDGLTAYQEGLFLPAEEDSVYSGWIAKATDHTRAIRLMTTVNVAEVGLLEAILPAFEEEFGYEVEILAEKEEEIYLCAALGEADLVLAPAPREGDIFAEHANFRTLPGFKQRHIPLLRCPYVLCGPAEDPAGVKSIGDAADAVVSVSELKLRAALKAIAETGCYFISRGDGSEAHWAERKLWPEAPEGDWYFAADTEMGPCLTIAEEMGGYVLSDALTFEIFRTWNGIVS